MVEAERAIGSARSDLARKILLSLIGIALVTGFVYWLGGAALRLNLR